jgi:hypothetical protein
VTQNPPVEVAGPSRSAGTRFYRTQDFPLVVLTQPGKVQLRHLRASHFRGVSICDNDITVAGHQSAYLADAAPSFAGAGGFGGVLRQRNSGVSRCVSQL